MSLSALESNRITFDEAIERIARLLAEEGLRPEQKVRTSRDPDVVKLAERVHSVLGAQFARAAHLELEGPARSTYTISGANAHLRPARTERSMLHLIICGSAWIQGHELSAGDWFHVPGGVSCAIDVGRAGFMSVSVVVSESSPIAIDARHATWRHLRPR